MGKFLKLTNCFLFYAPFKKKKDQFGERSERSEDLRPRRVNLLARPPVVPQSCGCSWQFGLRLRRAGISIQEVISMCVFTLGQGFKQ